MSFLDLEKMRYSVRAYTDQPVEKEKLDKILEAGRLAPTAVNYQPQRIYVLESRESLDKVHSLTHYTYDAPVVLMVCYDDRVSWKNRRDGFDSGVMDASIVTSLMMMEAADLGLGTLWIRGYDNNALVASFALPEHIKPVCLLAVGYAADGADKSRTGRDPIESMVEYI